MRQPEEPGQSRNLKSYTYKRYKINSCPRISHADKEQFIPLNRPHTLLHLGTLHLQHFAPSAVNPHR